jgi:hypothetical protein
MRRIHEKHATRGSNNDQNNLLHMQRKYNIIGLKNKKAHHWPSARFSSLAESRLDLVLKPSLEARA